MPLNALERYCLYAVEVNHAVAAEVAAADRDAAIAHWFVTEVIAGAGRFTRLTACGIT